MIEKLASLYDTTPGYIMGWEEVEVTIDKASDQEAIINAYYQKLVRMSIKDRELELINKYRAASQEVQGVIDKILGMER